MFTILSEVDRLKGNYEDVFIYTLNAGFSGVAGDVENAEIRIFIPETLDIYLGDVESPVQEVREEIVTGGKNVIFDFGTIEDLGIAVRIGFGIAFKQTTLTGERFELNSQMYINGELEVEYTNEAVELEVIPRFEISREVVLPVIDPAPGGEVFYKVTLENFNDLGAEIQNVEIISSGTDGITIDTSFPVIGTDTTTNARFIDNRYDNLQGVFDENSVIFTLPAFKGERYEFIYKATIAEELEIGTEIITNTTWSIDGVPDSPDVNTITLGELLAIGTISAYGPDYTLQDKYIGYEFNVRNQGNKALNSVTITETLPQEIEYYEFKTGTFHFQEINVDIDVEYEIGYTTILGEIGTFGPFNTSINSTVDLQFILEDGDNLSTLTWNLPQINVGMRNKVAPKIDGIVKSDVILNTTIVNEMELMYIENGEEEIVPNSKSTLVQDTCILNTSFTQDNFNTPVKPGAVLNYGIGATCRESRLNNPIIAFLLPKELEYIGNETLSYTDYFENPETPILPPAVIIPDINEEGDSIVKFEFKDEFEFDFRQKSTFSINFQTRVKIGAKGLFETFMILNTIDSVEVIPDESDIYRDTNNIADNPLVSPIYAKSSTNENRILFFVSTRSNKKVKGLLDEEYLEEPFIGNTTAGGNIDYKISITNIGNVELEKVEVVDILPHIGDTGVIGINTQRESGYAVYTIEEVKAQIVSEDETVQEAEFDIFYSNSYDPVRFGAQFDIIGTDPEWLETLPEALVDVKSFKVITKDIVLNPNETLVIDVSLVAPLSTPVDTVAWNSFAADVVYKNLAGEDTHLLAIEPEKVGIQIQEVPLDKGEINGYIWFDSNKDGLPDEGLDGINDVGVVLLDEEGTILNYMFTVPNFDGNNGYYSFSNLDYGNYVLRFFKDPKYIFTNKNETVPEGSKVNSKTNLSDTITINETNRIVQVNGGLIDKPRISIEYLLKVNESCNKTFKSVVRNQLLLAMKTEDTIKIIKYEEGKK